MPEPPALRTNDGHAGPWKSPQFRTMLAAISIIHIVFFAVYAIIPLRLVRDLGANEGFIAIFGLLELVGGALVSLRGTYLIERFGHRRMLTIALSITALAVAIVASASSLPLTLLGALLSGAAWTMAGGVVTYGMYSALTPAENSTSYSTAFHQVLGLSVFLGPFIGSALANSGADLATVLWVGAALRLAGCLAGGIVPSQHLRRAEGQAG
jgi:predicted MFS family arabinose efflux permease